MLAPEDQRIRRQLKFATRGAYISQALKLK